MHLVGFIIRVYHDALSPEQQIDTVQSVETPDSEGFFAVDKLQ
jgi:hypothetical protein